MRITVLTAICTVLLFFTGCGKQEINVPDFDQDNAMALVKKLVAFGPRSSGTATNLKQAEFIAVTAEKYGAVVLRQKFEQQTELGKLKFFNVEAVIRGERDDFVIIGSHFDTKKLPSGINFEGANDGASSTAALLEMIRAIKKSGEKPEYTLKFVFFDGEECISEYAQNDGLFGSKYYARRLREQKLVKKCRAVIILDMIGDKELRITLPANSDKNLRKMLLDAARRTGNEKYFSDFHFPILDDHTPFEKLGIPVIDIIDFEFGPGNSFWHTSEDNIQNISANSLKIVGQTVLNMLFPLKFP